MEVKIGVQDATRELVIDSDQSTADLESTVSKAISGDDAVLTLSDTRGRTVMVPVAKLAYVEIGSAVPGHVGFRS